MEEVVGQAQSFADAARGPNRLVGEHGHGSHGDAGRIVQLVQGLEGVENARVGVGEVELVLAVVLEKEGVGPGEEIFVDLVERDVTGQCERAPHEHGGAVADEAGNRGVGQRAQVGFSERCIDAVAEILRRVDERAVEIEDQQLQSLNGNGAKDADHASSVTGGVRPWHGVCIVYT